MIRNIFNKKSKQNLVPADSKSFLYKCLMYESSDNKTFFMNMVSPIVRAWHYGIFNSIMMLIPYHIRIRYIYKSHIVKIPPCEHSIDTGIFNASFVLLGKFVEEELGKAPSEKEQQENIQLWGYRIDTYRGYRLHSNNHEAIDLWLWYKNERQKALNEEIRLQRFAYGRIDQYEFDFTSSLTEPEEIKQKRNDYYRALSEFKKKSFGTFDDGTERESEDLDDEKLLHLMSIRRTLWT